MPRPGTTTTTTTSSGSRLLSRLGSGSAEKWGDSSVDTPQPTRNSATPAIHGNISKSKNGVLSATTSTSSSTGIRPLITGSSISSANHSSEVNKTQESLTWSPSPERPRQIGLGRARQASSSQSRPGGSSSGGQPRSHSIAETKPASASTSTLTRARSRSRSSSPAFEIYSQPSPPPRPRARVALPDQTRARGQEPNLLVPTSTNTDEAGGLVGGPITPAGSLLSTGTGDDQIPPIPAPPELEGGFIPNELTHTHTHTDVHVETPESIPQGQAPGGFILPEEEEPAPGGFIRPDPVDVRVSRGSTSTATSTPGANVNGRPRPSMTAKTPEELALAKERRRAAMLAAMNGTTSGPPGSIDGAVAGSTGASSLTSGSASTTTSSRTGTSTGVGSKRALQRGDTHTPSGSGSSAFPWEPNGLTSTSKISLPTPTTARGANTDPSLNIRQKVVLSSEQRNVLGMVVDQGRSVFFTGSAGTGKSVLLREIIRALKKKYAGKPDAVAVTASTGIAACNIGGVTIHSFGGIGLGADTPEKLCQNIRKNKKALSRWTRTNVLIMDEVSMVDGDLFDKLSKIGGILRRKPDRPFGGIQIVVTGDFFQLPPVTKHNKSPTFAFEAATWNETVSASVNLTKVFRQRDQTFVDMLNEMRFGKMSSASIARFAGLKREIFYTDGIEPTELFPRREDVERANQTRLQQLRSETWTYNAVDGPGPRNDTRDKILSNMMAAEHIVLKKDAQVMLIKNVDETLVNGSMGKVIGFCERHLYREDTTGRWVGEPMGESSDDDSVGEDGAPRKKRKTSAAAKANGEKLPVVSFRMPGGGTRDVIVEKDTFKTELPNGEIQASRLQLPLILAWAMSIHKSQGQTLDRVKVDLGRVFEKGQAYVALSRATSLDGLQVTGFNAAKVMAHHKVTTWSQNLVTYE